MSTVKADILSNYAGTKSMSVDNIIGRSSVLAWCTFTGNANVPGTYNLNGSNCMITYTTPLITPLQMYSPLWYCDFTTGTAVDGSYYAYASTTTYGVFNYDKTPLTTNGNVTVMTNPVKASRNISSIIDNGVGDYTIVFTTALTDTNYAIVAMSKGSDASDFSAENVIESYNSARTTSLVRICNSYNGTAYDTPMMSVLVVGN